MSELTANSTNRKELRWQLLTTVSATLLVNLTAVQGRAEEETHPAVWIELGGQLEHLGSDTDPYSPGFLIFNADKAFNVVSPTTVQKLPRFDFGGEGKLSFEPHGSDWVFSAAVRYGRSENKGSQHQQTHTRYKHQAIKYNAANPQFVYATDTHFNDTTVKNEEEHAIIDFTAGKDVGLGMFGRGGRSVVDLGVRIAQMHIRSNINFRSLPENHPGFLAPPTTANPGNRFHSYYAAGDFTRTFNGVGPTISWDASLPVLGNEDRGEVLLDWGVNAAALFGRQKVRGSHETTSWYVKGKHGVHYASTALVSRSRSVTIPNVGGFAGVSVRKANAKISFGYRADFFFGAMDGGIGARHTEDVGFHGPFATVGIGLGG